MLRKLSLILAVTTRLSAGADIDPAVMKVGQQQFLICAACHGQNAEGTAAAPPLAGSEWVMGPEENLIRIQLRGLQGPIKVSGKEYNFTGGMAALAYQTDEQIAAILTYVRNSFGNSAPPVSATAVAALRGEVGKPQITAAELTAPTTEAPTVVSGKYDDLNQNGPSFNWIYLAAALGIAVLGLIGRIYAARSK